MVQLTFVVTDIVLLALAVVALIYSLRARSLYGGDIMGRVFLTVTIAFAVMGAFAVLDAAAQFTYVGDNFPILRVGGTISTVLVVFALITLLSWATPPKKPKSAP